MNPMRPGEALLQMGFCTVWIANPQRLWDPVARPRFYNMCICEKGLSSLHSIFTFGKNFIKFPSISHSEILLSGWRERGSVCWCQAIKHLLIFFPNCFRSSDLGSKCACLLSCFSCKSNNPLEAQGRKPSRGLQRREENVIWDIDCQRK